MYHDMGLVGMAIGAVYGALSAVLLTPQAFVKRPVDWLRAISRHRGTISFAPNFAYDLAVRRVKETDLEGLDLSSWRVAGCGAEPIHAPTLAAFAEKFRAAGFREHQLSSQLRPRRARARRDGFSARTANRASNTSSADDVTRRGVATTAPAGHAEQRHRRRAAACRCPVTGSGLPMSTGDALPERGIGEITLAGPSVTPGYYNDAELTATSIRDGWLHTGDLGYLSNGELFVCGRVKDVIIVNGRKHHAQDLEWSIADLAGIRRGRVVAFGTAERGSPNAPSSSSSRAARCPRMC